MLSFSCSKGSQSGLKKDLQKTTGFFKTITVRILFKLATQILSLSIALSLSLNGSGLLVQPVNDTKSTEQNCNLCDHKGANSNNQEYVVCGLQTTNNVLYSIAIFSLICIELTNE
jgi:hypothetical protein